MALRYMRVARTTAHVEDAMHTIDRVLTVGFSWKQLRWDWREMYVTTVRDSNHVQTMSAIYIAHTKRVKIRGQTFEGHTVTAIVEFTGCTHEEDSAFDRFDTIDHSEELAISEIAFEIVTQTKKTFTKKCYMEKGGDTFFIR